MRKRFLFLIILLSIMVFARPLISKSSAAIPEDKGWMEVYFCPRDDCAGQVVSLVEEFGPPDCAFYEMNHPEIIGSVSDSRVVVDNRNADSAEGLRNVIFDTRPELMHNKFCIFGDVVLTGSFNPTVRGNDVNNNNIIILNSEHIAKNYRDEFEELWSGIYGGGRGVENPVVRLNDLAVENYFCPEDECEKRVLEVLESAEKSVYFMTFSFTSDAIGGLLTAKAKKGIDVKGVFEKSQNNKYSEFQKMNSSGIEVFWDKNPANMHHKVFIIDEETVITGSYNPTNNGNKINDENILIIHDRFIAERFMEEFEIIIS